MIDEPLIKRALGESMASGELIAILQAMDPDGTSEVVLWSAAIDDPREPRPEIDASGRIWL